MLEGEIHWVAGSTVQIVDWEKIHVGTDPHRPNLHVKGFVYRGHEYGNIFAPERV